MKYGAVLSILFFLSIATVPSSQAQVGINTDTPNSRAVLDLHSPTHDQGLLVPRLSRSQRMAEAFTSRLTSAENGLLIFDTDDGLFYYWTDTGWRAVDQGAASTKWHSGALEPDNTLGVEGDYYLNVTNGDVYQSM